MEVDIAPDLSVATELGIDKDNAVKSIDYSKSTGIDRTAISENFENTFKFDVNKTEIRATPILAKYSQKSPVNAAAIKQDVTFLGNLERHWNKVAVAPEKTLVSSQLARDNYHVMMYDNTDKPSDGSYFKNGLSDVDNDVTRNDYINRIAENDLKLQDLSKYDREDDSIVSEIPSGVTSVFVQMADAVAKQPKYAALGALAGGITGPVGAVSVGVGAASAVDNFQITSGNIFYEGYVKQPDEIKAQINKKEAMYISLAAGAASGAIEFIPAGKLAGKFLKKGATEGAEASMDQALKKIPKSAWRELMVKGSKTSLGKAAIALGKAIFEQGLPEYTQSLVEQTGNIAIDPTKELTPKTALEMATSKDALGSLLVGTAADFAPTAVKKTIKTGVGIYQSSSILNNERGAIGDQPSDGKSQTPRPDPVKEANQKVKSIPDTNIYFDKQDKPTEFQNFIEQQSLIPKEEIEQRANDLYSEANPENQTGLKPKRILDDVVDPNTGKIDPLLRTITDDGKLDSFETNKYLNSELDKIPVENRTVTTKNGKSYMLRWSKYGNRLEAVDVKDQERSYAQTVGYIGVSFTSDTLYPSFLESRDPYLTSEMLKFFKRYVGELQPSNTYTNQGRAFIGKYADRFKKEELKSYKQVAFQQLLAERGQANAQQDNADQLPLEPQQTGVEQLSLAEQPLTKPTPKEVKFVLKENLEQDKAQLKEKTDTLKSIIEIKDKVSIKDTAAMDEIETMMMSNDTNYIVKEDIMRMAERNKSFKAAFERITKHKIDDENKSLFTVSDRELITLYKYNQDILNNFQITPEGNTNSKYQTFLEDVEKNKQKVSDVVDRLDNPNLTDEERAAIDTDITSTLEGSTEGVYDEETRNAQPIFSPEIIGSLPEAEVASLTAEITDARAQVAEATVKARQAQIDKIVSLDYKVEIDKKIEQVEEILNTDEKGQLKVERQYDGETTLDSDLVNALRFIYPEHKDKSPQMLVDDVTAKHKEKGFSAIAIDPDSLPANLKAIFRSRANNKHKIRLKEKKVFVKGGLKFDTLAPVARALGFKDAYDLFNDLASKPSRQELFDGLAEQASKDQYAESLNDFGADQDDFLDAFSNKAKIHLKEIYTVMREKTGEARKLIKRLGRIQTIDSMKAKSKDLTRKLKVRDLNPRIYRRNQNIAMREAADALAGGDFLNFFSNKEKQTLNTLLEADVQRAAKVINRKYAKVAKLFRKKNQEILAKAGEDYVELFNTLKAAIEFNPDKKPITVEQLKVLESLEQAGHVIPEALLSVNDAKVHVSDLTYDQTVALLDTMINTFAAAQEKVNLVLQEEVISLLDAETIFAEQLRDRKDGDPENYNKFLQFDKRDKSWIRQQYETVTKALTTYSNSIYNYNNIINKLDLGDINGFANKVLVNGLKFAESVRAANNKQFDDYLTHISKLHNVELNKYNTIKVTIPELSQKYKDGVVPKGDLLGMMGQLGSSAKDRLARDLGMTVEQVQGMLEKYTTKEDAKIVQSLHNFFEKNMWPRKLEQHRKLNLAPPEKVIAVPYKIHGIDMAGGYYPMNVEQNAIEKSRKNARDWVDLIKDNKIVDTLFTSVINTFDGSNKNRIENASSPLNYSFNAFKNSVREMNHNDAFGIELSNVGKLLSNKAIQKDIITVIGLDNFTTILQHLEKVAHAKDDNKTSLERDLEQFTNRVMKGLYIAKLGSLAIIRPATSLKQYISLVPMHRALLLQSKDKSNATVLQYIANASLDRKVINPREVFRIAEHIAKTSPQMRAMIDQMTHANPSFLNTIYKLEERFTMDEGKSKGGKFLDFIKLGSMSYLNYIQMRINITHYVAAYRMAMDGKVQNVDANDDAASKMYADKQVELTLSNNSTLLDPTIYNNHKWLMFAGRQQLIMTQQFFNSNDLAEREMKIDPSNKTKATTKALVTAMFYMVGPWLLNDYINDMFRNAPKGDDEEEKYPAQEGGTEKDKSWLENAYDAMSPIADQLPIVKDAKYPIDRFLEAGGKNPNTIEFSNPLLRLADDSLRFIGAAIISAFDDGVQLTKKDWTRFSKVMNTALQIPEYGTTNFVQWLLELLDVPDKRKQPAEGEDEPADFIDVADPNNALPEESAAESKSSFVQEIKNKLNDSVGGDNVENRKALVVVRNKELKDITNPEGLEITARHAGVLKTFTMSEKDHDDLTIMIDAISRYETNNQTVFIPKTGTARGFLQFVQSTWNNVRKDYPDLNLPDKVVSASKHQQYAAMWKLVGEHVLTLQEFKMPRTIENLYLLHLLGRGTFKIFKSLDEDIDVKSDGYDAVFSVKGNPKVFGTAKSLTVKQLRTRLKEQFKPNMNAAIDYVVDNDYLTYNEP